MHRKWKQRGTTMLIIGATVMLITACGSEETNDVLEEIDPPQIDYIEDEEELDLEVFEAESNSEGDQLSSITQEEVDVGDNTAEEKGGSEEKGGALQTGDVQELYLLDKNGMVAPQSISIELGEDEVKTLVDHLVQEGPITEQLPNGFQAVLPAGTEVVESVVDKQGVATVDFNTVFNDYHPSQELQILQSLTWTLTQLDDVDRVKLKMNGEELTAMPQNDTPIGGGYTRDHGINLEMNDQADLVATTPVVVYFLAQNNEETYYVPVTRRVNETDNKYEAVINELLEGPSYTSQLLTDFREEVALMEEPTFKDGTLHLDFNEGLLSQINGTAMSEEALNMLVLSLTEQEEVEDVSLSINSDPSVMVSNGQEVSAPVARPTHVNSGRF
ncbi:GerMN domain-containing protein [Salipaludibacillus sp. CF4.18]|uniref:GerMN domain-containing protein n=1 Tax=Salipaludibacillus sp. CF4.18 TaxID=3373081 RepID=UPI003EE8106A